MHWYFSMDKDVLYKFLNASVETQIDSLIAMREHIDDHFWDIVELLLNCRGRVVISGIGKSGLVGQKITATLASTGTASFFLHSTEAFHGDLGMLRQEDVVILISYSGETDDVNKLIPSLKGFGNKIIAMTGSPKSTLAKHCDFVLNIAVDKEICPYDLAPTSSSLVTMALGDLLAVVLMKARNFEPKDFAKYHPGGNLGKRLLATAGDLMDTELPSVDKNSSVSDCLFVLSQGRKGICMVMEGEQLLGVITDGDIRRNIIKLGKQQNIWDKKVTDLMTSNPRCIDKSASWGEVEDDIREHRIRPLVVMDNGKPVGLVGLLDTIGGFGA